MPYQPPELVGMIDERAEPTGDGRLAYSYSQYFIGIYRDIEFKVGTAFYTVTEEDVAEDPDGELFVGDVIEWDDYQLLVRIGDKVNLEKFGSGQEALDAIAKRIDELLAQGGIPMTERFAEDGGRPITYAGIKVKG